MSEASQKHGRELLHALEALYPELLVRERPEDFEWPPLPTHDRPLRKGFWECDLCGRRLKACNASKHIGAPECAFAVEVRAREWNGWRVLPLNSLRLCVAGRVPLWPGPVRLVDTFDESGLVRVALPHWERKVVDGVWAPRWAFTALDWSFDRTRHQRTCLLQRFSRGEDERATLEAAYRLDGWQGVRQLLK